MEQARQQGPMRQIFSSNDTKENRKALLKAADNGKTEVVRRYIGMGVDVDWQDGFGGTALSAAAWRGHVAVVELLLAANANPNLRSNVRVPPRARRALSRSRPPAPSRE